MTLLITQELASKTHDLAGGEKELDLVRYMQIFIFSLHY